ncbi:MAG: hypothetical protein DWP97_10975 [Calditrichaeota bacterium]|nr:MAG: hypothetical protein DWP97_10975 [Calditrichota bacterium]
MKSYYKHILITALTLIIVLCSFTSCSDDIVLPPLQTLLGDYSGRYIVKTDLSVGGGVTRVDQAIDWRFTDGEYRLILLEGSENICNPSGTYKLTGEVTLDQVIASSNVVCDESYNPVGVFSLRQPEDSVILIQQEDNVLKELRLKRN